MVHVLAYTKGILPTPSRKGIQTVSLTPGRRRGLQTQIKYQERQKQLLLSCIFDVPSSVFGTTEVKERP